MTKTKIAKYLATSFDPEKAYKRVYSLRGRYVKIHTHRVPTPFGRIVWKITGSECDKDGKALVLGVDPKILKKPNGEPAEHLVQFEGETPTDMGVTLEAERISMVERVVTAAEMHDEAMTIS